jgi:hypothetical protein
VHEKVVVPLSAAFVIKVKDMDHHKKVFINILYRTATEQVDDADTVEKQQQPQQVEQEDYRVYLVREDMCPDHRQNMCPTFDLLIDKKLVELCEQGSLQKKEV